MGDEDNVAAALQNFGSEKDGEESAKLRFREECVKPEKPVSFRFGTFPRTLAFIRQYFLALQFAANELRKTATDVSAGMCMEFIKWSASTQLQCLLEMASEFCVLWKKYDDMINLPDLHYGVEGRQKVFSRTRRALDFLLEVEHVLDDVTALPSFKNAQEAFGDDRGEDVRRLYLQLYSMAKERILHNSGRYFRGVYLYGAFGDPEFALVAWEVFSTLHKHRHRPQACSVAAKRLLELAKVPSVARMSDMEKQYLDGLTATASLDEMYQLLKPLRGNAPDTGAFVRGVLAGKSVVAETLRGWLVQLSTTQPVEFGFRQWDVRGGAQKSKASTASGAAISLQTVESRVRTATVLSKAEANVLDEKKKEKKRRRAEAKKDIAVAISRAFDNLKPTKEEMKSATEKFKNSRGFFARPYLGVSVEIDAVQQEIEKQWADYIPPNNFKHFGALLLEGRGLKVEIRIVCVAECERPVGSKGRPLAVFCCTGCKREFHVKCMRNLGFVEKGKNDKECQESGFLCELCGGVTVATAVGENVSVRKRQAKRARTRKEESDESLADDCEEAIVNNARRRAGKRKDETLQEEQKEKEAKKAKKKKTTRRQKKKSAN